MDENTEELVPIPPRSTSRYNGQHSRVVDAGRLLELWRQSCSIAMESKKRDTATARFELAVECYWQLMELSLTSEVQESLQKTMHLLARNFPGQVCMNAALGLCDEANKKKTIKAQLKLLLEARDLLVEGLARKDSNYDAINSIYVQVVDYIKKAEELAKGPESAS